MQLTKRKACLQCTRSKRKCDRSSPRCLRCLDKGVDCEYPPSRRARYHREASLADQHEPRSASLQQLRSGHQGRDSNSDAQDLLVNDRWFLTPESFVRLLHNGLPPNEPISQYQDRILGDETVEFLETVQEWMKQWATEGHSPVVHRNLYSGGYMPECVEDAFTVLATYHSSPSPQIRKTALQIASRRASKLIASFLVTEFQPQQYSELYQPNILDTQAHLARTLALLTYQVIGLLDTDIRARSNAEDYMETLNSWATQMLESARLDSLTADIEAGTPAASLDNTTPETADPAQSFDQTAQNPCLGANPFVLPPKPSSTSPSRTAQHHHITSLHRAWLIAESVRRIWLTAMYTQSVYTALKAGAGTHCPSSETSGCPGGMTFTARAGLWDAPSGYRWFELVKGAVGGTQEGETNEGWKVLEGLIPARPRDVDEFTRAILLICFGKEWIMERWLDLDKDVGEDIDV
ncbi:hypothetical protein V8F20_007982 [Naviculisporaceae sp. PSN 640]